MKSILIKDTTREEREEIVRKALFCFSKEQQQNTLYLSTNYTEITVLDNKRMSQIERFCDILFLFSVYGIV